MNIQWCNQSIHVGNISKMNASTLPTYPILHASIHIYYFKYTCLARDRYNKVFIETPLCCNSVHYTNSDLRQFGRTRTHVHTCLVSILPTTGHASLQWRVSRASTRLGIMGAPMNSKTAGTSKPSLAYSTLYSALLVLHWFLSFL